MNFTQRFERNSRSIFREEDDGAFLFDPETGNLKYLNRSAKDVFLMINGQNDISKVIDRLFGLYHDVDRKQIQTDVESFLTELKENGFISSLDAE